MTPHAKGQNKTHTAGQGRRAGRRPLVSSAVVARAAPVTPIPALTILPAQPDLKTVAATNGAVRTVKKWCFDRTPVYCAPDEPWPSATLNAGAVVELTGQNLGLAAAGIKTSWLEVAYRVQNAQAGLQWVTGWVNAAYLDDYNEKFPDSGVAIPTPTPDPTDAQQYLILEGKVRYNMCGELCVAFIVNDDIESVLGKWKKNSPGSYNAILAAGRDKPTSDEDLKNMLAAIVGEYGYAGDTDQLISLRAELTYPVDPVSLPEDLKRLLPTHYLISGVKISGGTGQLVRKDHPLGIGHWIVLDKLTRSGKRVEVYNPFPNKHEEYSFSEFYNSFSTNSGIWVKRKKPVSSSHAETLPVLQVAIENPNPSYRAAQYIDIEGRKKTNLCGEFCVAFIVQESIEAVLRRWKEVQPYLYGNFVGGNKGTGTFDLGTILRAYGYNTAGDFADFSNGLMDPFLKRSLVSPGRIAKMLRTHFLIAGVNIDGTTGRLKPGQDVRHWVVVDKLTPVGKNRGWVELYNPFPNCWEEYSYSEFTSSVGSWSGLWVKRNIIPLYIPQKVESAHAEEEPRKDGRIDRWTEAQLDAVIRQKSKSAKSINKIAAELAELSGWKRPLIISKLKAIQTRSIRWTETRLWQEMQRRLREGRPIRKIPAESAKLSGWKEQDVIALLKKVIEAERWTEAQLLAAIAKKLKATRSANKIAAELSERSGWKVREIITRVKQLIEAQRWPAAQLRDEIKKRWQSGKPVGKIPAQLVRKSGWKEREIGALLKQLLEAEKWTEPQLLAAIREKLSAEMPANKIAAELAERSGWKRREILLRVKQLSQAVKWTETELRSELAKRLELGKSASKIAYELAEVSGWKRWQISRILKAITARQKVARNKTRLTILEEPPLVVDPSTIIQASKPRAEFLQWQDSLLSPANPKLYKIRKWGDPVMVKYAFDVFQAKTSNFQAVGLYNNGNREFGAITNFLRIPHADVLKLKAMQIEDEYEVKKEDWRSQKMEWLCDYRGTIYFYDGPSDDWKSAPCIRWGTAAIGGNVVHVLDIEIIEAKMRDGLTRKVEMARLKGFRASDWDRPLDQLLAEGLVHRCFCAYKNNAFGDSPKGIVYSPFFSPQDWDFTGKAKADALYIPTEWLEPKGS